MDGLVEVPPCQDVNFEKRIVTLWTRKRKGGSYESDPMPMNQDLYNVLWHLWEDKQQNKWVFFNEKTGTRYMHRPKLMKSLCMRAFDPGCNRVKDYNLPNTRDEMLLKTLWLSCFSGRTIAKYLC